MNISIQHIKANCRLTVPVVKKPGDRNRLPEITHIGMFKCGRLDPAIGKHIYNESANYIKNHAVDFNTNGLVCVTYGIT